MRFLLLFALLLSPALAKEKVPISFVRVWPSWKDVDSFKKISEYFTDREDPGKLKIVRSKPESRDGFYFTVRVANNTPPIAGSHFVLKIVTPDSPFPKTFNFPADVPKGDTVYNLGLTGTDWPGRHAHPVAWKLQLVDGSGTALVSQISFLWNPTDP